MHDNETAVSNVSIEDYRLPSAVIPERYEIRLEPDLSNFTFTGEETVYVRINEPVRQISLNALELEIDRVEVEREGRRLSGTIEMNEKLERAKFSFEGTLEPGDWKLRIVFRGSLNDKLHGFYRSQYQDASGKTHLAATTQFEATDARRAFPCWDEPALKASYKITLVVDEHLMAISNASVERENLLGNARKEVVFLETIRMSTYLVAFIVGEFEATDPVNVDGTPLRIVHVPGKRALTKWSLEIGAFSIRWFSKYYGIRYPGDKLDLIAIPDFASGAMENLGAITFRETALLVDENRASRAELERVADVVSHENAHMWFGDLVTMRWWNGIWLNEAFATFMEMLVVDAWKPGWQRWTSFGVSRAAAMAVDGLQSTRSIEFTVHAPSDCRAMFDVLTYEKGASVLRMLEQYLGGEEFREGIALYLKRHEYNNTETGDLWDALEDSSGQPARALMDSWIFQPGFPIISVEPADAGRALKLSQHRFFYLPQKDAEPQLWHVPVMVRVMTDQGVSHHKLLLTKSDQSLELPGKLKWAVVNEGGHGYYRSHYSSELIAALTAELKELAPIERFALVNDTWAATVSGVASLADFLKMARLFRDEEDLNVWRALLGALSYLDMIAEEGERPALAGLVRDLLGPIAAKLGWTPHPGEHELQSQLRGTIISTLGVIGDDREVQMHARELFAQYKKNPAAVDRNVAPALVAILAHAGSEAEYREFKEAFKSAKTPQEEQRFLFSLAGFRRPELLRQTMEMTLNGEVRNQNAPYLFHSLLYNQVFRGEAWAFMQRNWVRMERQYPDNAIPRMCEGVVSLWKFADEVTEFFRTHKVKEGGKIIDQHLERMRVAVEFRKREGKNLAGLLQG